MVDQQRRTGGDPARANEGLQAPALRTVGGGFDAGRGLPGRQRLHDGPRRRDLGGRGTEPGVIDTDYLDSIKQTVQTLADHGVYSVIDMHQDNWSTEFQGEGAPDRATFDGASAIEIRLPRQLLAEPGRAACVGFVGDNAVCARRARA